jgi:hypothetical protein
MLIKTEQIIGPQGEIEVKYFGSEFFDEPSIETYEFLKDYINLRIKIKEKFTNEKT